jgi:hypothetical protein
VPLPPLFLPPLPSGLAPFNLFLRPSRPLPAPSKPSWTCFARHSLLDNLNPASPHSPPLVALSSTSRTASLCRITFPPTTAGQVQMSTPPPNSQPQGTSNVAMAVAQSKAQKPASKAGSGANSNAAKAKMQMHRRSRTGTCALPPSSSHFPPPPQAARPDCFAARHVSITGVL